jgi:hypothetical protein
MTSGLEGKQLSEPPLMPRFWVSVVSGCAGENCFDDKTCMRMLVKSISMYVWRIHLDYLRKVPVILQHMPRQVQVTYHKMKNSSLHCSESKRERQQHFRLNSSVTWPFGPPVCHIVIVTYVYCWLLWHQPTLPTKHQEFCLCIVLYTWLYMIYFNHYIFPYTESSSSQQEGGLHEATPEVLHLILTNLLYGPKDQFGNTSYCLCKCGHSKLRV